MKPQPLAYSFSSGNRRSFQDKTSYYRISYLRAYARPVDLEYRSTIPSFRPCTTQNIREFET